MYYRSYNEIMEDALKRVDGYLSVDEGDTAWMLISPIALELEKLYGNLDQVINRVNILAAYNNNFDDDVFKFAEADGVSRNPAAIASGNITFYGKKGASILSGTKVYQYEGGLGYEIMENGVIAENGEVTLKAIAEDFGYKYNCPAHSISYFHASLSGVTSIDNTVPFTGGADEESVDDVFQRHRLKVQKNPNGANIAQYEQWCLENPSVAVARIFPCQKPTGNGGELQYSHGHVTCVIMDQQRKPCTQEVCEAVKNYIDPNDGSGTGVAPINAFVHVIPSTVKTLTVKFNVMLEEGYTKTEVFGNIKEQFDKYLTECFREEKVTYTTSKDSSNIITVVPCSSVRIKYSYLAKCIYDAKGVYDYENFTINNATKDIRLSSTDSPILDFEESYMTVVSDTAK